MTHFLSVISPDNTMSTSCLSSLLRLQQMRWGGSLMIDVSPSVETALTKAKNLTELTRVVILHASCGVSSSFITHDHPHPIVVAGYGMSAIDWGRMDRDFPYDTPAACAEAGTVYNFDIDTVESVGAEYLKTNACESKIMSIHPDAIDDVLSALDPATYIVSTPLHIYIDAQTLHNVEFCFVGSFIDKYGAKKPPAVEA